MPDNVTAPVTGKVFATKDASGVHHPREMAEYADPSGNPVQVAAATPMPVAQTGALPAGANAIGKLAANDGIDIGDVGAPALEAKADTLISLLGTSTAAQVWKSFAYTAAQTGIGLWTPASGKRIAITHIEVNIGGTTGGVVTFFFDDDTTYTAGTDQPVIAPWTVAPSATVKPFKVLAPASPIIAGTADYLLRLTTSAGITIDGVVYGYEL